MDDWDDKHVDGTRGIEDHYKQQHFSVVHFVKNMEGIAEVGEYKPPEDFVEVKRDPLIDINLTDSTELWLVQWPINQAADFNGQEVSLKLHHDGLLGTFEGSSGKSYEVVSYNSQEPEATVFLPSASECKIVGKISRRASLVHYPDPEELKKSDRLVFKQMAERSATSLTNSASPYATPSQGRRSRNSGPVSGYTSRTRSDLSFQDSGREHTAVTPPTGSLEQSRERKSKKRRKSEV